MYAACALQHLLDEWLDQAPGAGLRSRGTSARLVRLSSQRWSRSPSGRLRAVPAGSQPAPKAGARPPTLPPSPPFATHKLVITEGGRYTIQQGERITRGSLKLDPAPSPKHYDVTIATGPNEGQVTHGIYEIDGDTYRVCLPLGGWDRPALDRPSTDWS